MSEKLLNRIRKIDRLSELLADERARLLQQWAEIVCPYQVGDQTNVKGYAHKDKECQITRVSFSSSHRYGPDEYHYQWRVYARLYKQDGSLGKQTVDWTESQEKQKTKQKPKSSFENEN